MKPSAILKSRPEDFIVEEIPLYVPSGEGHHMYVTFEKRMLTTMDAVRRIGGALGISGRDIGVAGLKDKVGVSTQTISLPCPLADTTLADRARALTIEGIRILDAKRHGNKLRTGHLTGNRFRVRLRGIERSKVDEASEKLKSLAESGVPNRFGDQRFGSSGDNVARACAWLSGREPRPRDQKVRRFLCSALQSEVFNRVLARRLEDGTWNHAVVGDVLQVTSSGGLFACEDAEADEPRVRAFEVTPTGPLPGPKMKAPVGAIAAMETLITDEVIGADVDRAELHSHAEGTRRPLRIQVKDLSFSTSYEDQGESAGADEVWLDLVFELGSGTYATTVLGEVFALRDTSRPEAASPSSGPTKDELHD